MANTKHGPNRLHNYQAVHDSVMEYFIRTGFVVSHNLEFTPVAGGRILLEGRIECQAGLFIDVRKTLTVLEGNGPNALVQTVIYTYHAALPDGRSLFRYDSPDLAAMFEAREHHRHHHKHLYDPLHGVKELGIETILNEDACRPSATSSRKWRHGTTTMPPTSSDSDAMVARRESHPTVITTAPCFNPCST